MRARDVVGVAREAVAADLGLQARAAAHGVRLALEDEQPGALAEEEPLAVQVERLASLRRHRGEADEAAELELLEELGGAR